MFNNNWDFQRFAGSLLECFQAIYFLVEISNAFGLLSIRSFVIQALGIKPPLDVFQ